MNITIPTDQAERKKLFNELRGLLFPGIIIIVCIILFFAFIIPQIQGYMDTKSQNDAKAKQVTTLKNNVDLLSSYPQTLIDNKFQVVAQALPTEKDFISILVAISRAASKANVGLNNYTFSVGKINAQTGKIGTPSSLQVNLLISASADKVAKFLSYVEKESPLSSEESLSISDGAESTVTLSFYYESAPKIIFNDEDPITQLSQQSNTTIQQLISWQSMVTSQ